MTSTLRPSLRDGSSLHRYPGTSCLALQFGHFEKAAPGNFHDFFLFYNFLLAS